MDQTHQMPQSKQTVVAGVRNIVNNIVNVNVKINLEKLKWAGLDHKVTISETVQHMTMLWWLLSDHQKARLD